LFVGAARADEASAVAKLEKIGARIKRDEKLPDKPVVMVSLLGPWVKGAALKEVASVKSLQMLLLCVTDVADAGLKELKKALPKCESIK
jgi:hypothetical protein